MKIIIRKGGEREVKVDEWEVDGISWGTNDAIKVLFPDDIGVDWIKNSTEKLLKNQFHLFKILLFVILFEGEFSS